jgi:hypothetical protein
MQKAVTQIIHRSVARACSRDSVQLMNTRNRSSRFVAAVLIATLAVPSLPLAAQEATIRVTRVALDRYAVVITTKYCHEYSRDEEALLTTRAEGAENALLFASGAQCEVISATKPEDSSFSILDFLIQLGLMIATKGVLGSPTPKAKPK